MAKRRAPAMATVDSKWQAEDDLRTIRRATEIQSSRQRMAAVKNLATQEQKALQQVTGSAKKCAKRGKP